MDDVKGSDHEACGEKKCDCCDDCPAGCCKCCPPGGRKVVEMSANPGPASNVGDGGNVKPSWFWVKDARGEGSVTVTLVTYAFILTSLAYVLSIVEHVGSVAIRPFDVGACGAFFIPILGLYGTRKYTQAKFSSSATGVTSDISGGK